MAKLKEVCTFFADGDWIESSDQSDEGIRLIQTGNIGEGKYLEKETRAKYISESTFNKLSCTEVYPGDILVSRLPEPVGRACIIPEKNERMITAVDCTICRPNETLISKEYMCYFMRSNVYHTRLLGSVTGTTRKRISRKNLGNVEVKIPPKGEQNAIVKQLDCLTSVISLRSRELELLDELVRGRFVEMFGDPYINEFGWKKIKIKNAVTVEPQNGMYKPQSDYVTDGSGIPILRIDGFYDGIVTDFSSLKRLKCSENERKKYLLYEDDVVINRVNSIEYLGKCAHINGLLEDTVYESNMMRMHFDSTRFHPVYVCRLLCSRFVYDQIVNHAKQAVNQASINQKDVLDFEIYEPPLKLQTKFSDFVYQVNKSKFRGFSMLTTMKSAYEQQTLIYP